MTTTTTTTTTAAIFVTKASSWRAGTSPRWTFSSRGTGRGFQSFQSSPLFSST